MVPYIFAFAGALAFIFNLDIKAIVGYLSAGLITAIAIIEELGSLPPPREYLIGYIIALFVIVMPLGNVLNLLWFLNPRFRVDATTAISASSPRPG